MVENEEAYVEKATMKALQEYFKQGKGSQKQAILALASPSNPLENTQMGDKSRHCGFFKLIVMPNV